MIVGAGPVGCLAACLFSAHGYSVELVEKRADPRTGSTGAGGRTINLSVSPRGLHALAELGCQDALLDDAVPMDRRIIHTMDGRRSATCYEKETWRNYSIARNSLNRLLLDQTLRCRDTLVRFATRCRGVDFDRRTLTLVNAAGRAERVHFDVLVGADGANSTVRQHLADQRLVTVSSTVLHSAYKELTLKPRRGTMYRAAIHVWPRRGFFLVALPDREADGTFRGTLVLPQDGRLGFANLQDGDCLRDFVHQHFADVEEDFTALSEEFGRNPVSRITTASCDTVSWRDSVVLMGDAAHTVAPFLGQGINLGFEDCVVLNQFLGDYRDRADALARYSRDRTVNGAAAATLSMDNYSELTSQAPPPAVTALPAAPSVPSAPILVNFLGLSYSEAYAALHASRPVLPTRESAGSAHGPFRAHRSW